MGKGRGKTPSLDFSGCYVPPSMSELEQELKGLIVDALELEDVTVEQIQSEAPLFGAGLGLDSIDALELASAISRRYGVVLQADDDVTRAAFSSVRALAAHIQAARA
jgi:acyl carrier protein